MKILIQHSGHNKISGKLCKMIGQHLKDVSIENIDSIDRIRTLLGKPLHKISSAVLFIEDQQQVQHLVSIKSLFDGVSLVLALMEENPPYLEACLVLNPSFISYYNSDLRHVVAVLEKIYQRTKNNRIIPFRTA
jgi:hypothetical protein